MVRVAHTFESGSDEADLTTSIGGGPFADEPFDIVQKLGSSTVKVRGEAAIHGALGCEFTTGASSTEACYAEYNVAIGEVPFIAGRWCGSVPSNPSATFQLIGVREPDSSQAWAIVLRTNGTLRIQDSLNSTIATSAFTVPFNTPFRIEWEAADGVTDGSIVVHIFAGVDDVDPVETIQGANVNLGTFGFYRVGAAGGSVPVGYVVEVDSVEWNTTGLPGPFGDQAISNIGGITSGELVGQPILSESGAPGQVYNFRASGLDGAGHVNVISLDPAVAGRGVCGSDVGGYWYSDTLHANGNGQRWSPKNGGFTTDGQGRNVAGIWHAKNSHAGKVFGASGTSGANSRAVFRSTDGGLTWAIRASGGSAPPVVASGTHPRPVGSVIVGDDSGASLVLWAAASDGVYRSFDEGLNWTRIALAGIQCVGLAFDVDSGALYVGTRGSSLHRILNASLNGFSVALVGGVPPDIEELVLVGTGFTRRMYLACGPQGLRRSDLGNPAQGYGANNNITPFGATWNAIDGVLSGGTHRILAGTSTPISLGGSGAAHRPFAYSEDGGINWTIPLTLKSQVKPNLGGPGGDVWWVSLDQSPTYLGNSAYVPQQVKIDPHDLNRWYSAGRQVVWTTPDKGANWYPLARRLNVTVELNVFPDPTNPGVWFDTNADQCIHCSTDRYNDNTAKPLKPAGSPANGFGLALDRSVSPARLYLGVGEDGVQVAGEIFSRSAAHNAAPNDAWTNENLAGAANGAIPLGLAFGLDDLGRQVLIAVCESNSVGGVYRKINGNWTGPIAPTTLPEQTQENNGWVSLDLQWPWGTADIFYIDPQNAIYRSTDYGVTWTNIWSRTHATLPWGSAARRAKIAYDPVNDKLYVSVVNGLYRVDSPRSGTVNATPSKAVNLGISDSAPITTDSAGKLYVVRIPNGSRKAQMLISADAHTGTPTFDDFADDVFRGQCLTPNTIRVGPDGTIAVANLGIGLCIGDLTAGGSPPDQAITEIGGILTEELVGNIVVDQSASPQSITDIGGIVTAEAVGTISVQQSSPGEEGGLQFVRAFFLPPVAATLRIGGRTDYSKTPAYRRLFNSYSVAENNAADQGEGFVVAGRKYQGGRWNGPLTQAEITALTAAGYGARIYEAAEGEEGALPGWID